MISKRFKVFYDAPGDTGAGGGTTPAPMAQPTGEPTGEPVVTGEPNLPVTEPTATGEPVNTGEPAPTTDPAPAGEETFNPDEINFDGNNSTGTFDMTQMEFLNDEGIDIADEDVSGLINTINEMGVTDPQIIAKFVRKAAENTKEPTAAEIKENLSANLSPELKANYSSINNTLKSAWGSDENFKGLIGGFMSNPQAVGAIHALINHLRGGANPNPTPSGVARSSQGLTIDKGIENYEKMMGESISKNGRMVLSEKQRIVNEIASKLNPVDVREFRSRYE